MRDKFSPQDIQGIKLDVLLGLLTKFELRIHGHSITVMRTIEDGEFGHCEVLRMFIDESLRGQSSIDLGMPESMRELARKSQCVDLMKELTLQVAKLVQLNEHGERHE